MSNLIKRTVPVILVLIVCITCLVFPAAASSFEAPDNYYNVLDYATPNGFSSTGVTFEDSASLVFDIPGTLLFSFVDIVISSTVRPSSVIIYNTSLTIDTISAGMYRISGNIPYTHYNDLTLDIKVSGRTIINFLSFHAFDTYLTGVPILGSVDYFNLSGIITSSHMDTPSSTLVYTFPDNDNDVQRFYVNLYSHNWYKYDYLAFRFRTRMNVGSVVAMSDNGRIPLSMTSTVLQDNTTDDNIVFYYCVMDVSSVRHLFSDDPPFLQIQLTSYGDKSRQFHFYDCTGFVSMDDVEPEVFWLRKLYYIFSDWISNGNSDTGISPELESALQTQEEINVSINNQLVGAVEDWNSNIEVVQTGYDTAVTKATPALVWLSSLADRIFNGMGWFGSIYFLVGLISVIMLILSKSGLAHKLGNISRRGD